MSIYNVIILIITSVTSIKSLKSAAMIHKYTGVVLLLSPMAPSFMELIGIKYD